MIWLKLLLLIAFAAAFTVVFLSLIRRPQVIVPVAPAVTEERHSSIAYCYFVTFQKWDGKVESAIHTFPATALCDEERRRWIIHEAMASGSRVVNICPEDPSKLFDHE